MSFTGSTSRFTLGYQVLVAIIAAIFVGVWLGPAAKYLNPFAETFSISLRMFVLPYIAFSVMHGLGSLTPTVAKKLLKKGSIILLVLWGLVCILVYMLSALIPKALVSPVVLENTTTQSLSEQLINYLIPQNLFNDFTNNMVPAVAMFGIIGGIAIMHLSTKEPMLGILERANDVLDKIFKWLAIISPFGIFAHVAVAAGTLNMEQLKQLSFYFVGYVGMTLVVVFYFLPTFICSLTTFHYRQVMYEFRTACVLAFATGVPAIAIPFIVRSVNKLAIEDPAFRSVSQTTIPLGITFAQIGNYLILFFMLFISYYYRHPFSLAEQALLPVLTIPMSLGAAAVSVSALSFFITRWGFPEGAYTLFLQTSALTTNLQVLMSVAAVLTFTLLVLLSYFGRLKVNFRKLVTTWGLGFLVFGALLWAAKGHFTMNDGYQRAYLDLKINSPLHAKFVSAENRPDEEVFQRILRTGVLRVGTYPDEMPYTYINQDNETVGFDVAFAYQLAEDLGCELEFVRLDWNTIADQLNNNQYDIGMAAILMDEDRIEQMDFTTALYAQKNVLIVRADRRKEFKDYDKVAERSGLKVGAEGHYAAVVKKHFPLATSVPIKTIDQFLTTDLDAVAYSYIPAVVWCFVHPEYVVVEYGDRIGSRFFSYAIKSGAWNWLSYLNNWLKLKKLSGFTKAQYKYWIGGDVPKVLEE